MNQGDMNYCKMEVRSYTNIYHRFYTVQILDVQNVTWILIRKMLKRTTGIMIQVYMYRLARGGHVFGGITTKMESVQRTAQR